MTHIRRLGPFRGSNFEFQYLGGGGGGSER